jgi:hypothetical protein
MGAASARPCSESLGQSGYAVEFGYGRIRTRHLSGGGFPSSERPRRNGNLSRRGKISRVRDADEMQRQGRAAIALLPKIAALELAYGIRSNVILCYADGERVSPFPHRG